MTMKEYAHSCAEELKKSPTQKTVVKVCNRILHAQVDGRDITSSAHWGQTVRPAKGI